MLAMTWQVLLAILIILSSPPSIWWMVGWYQQHPLRMVAGLLGLNVGIGWSVHAVTTAVLQWVIG